MSWLSGFEDVVRAAEPLAPHTWLGLGGAAEYFAEPQSVDELSKLVAQANVDQIPIHLLGGGSNILVRDEGVQGLVIRLSADAFTKIAVKGSRVTAGGGAKLGHVISSSVCEGLAGLESLVGIPGTIGGALHGNAGTRVGDIGQWTLSATVMNRKGEITERGRDSLVFSYRESSLDELVILRAEFDLEPDDRVAITKRMQQLWIVRKSSQPLGHQPTGCIFKNPRGMSAGTLIDQAGLKGTKMGGAEVSERHANFVVTHPGATALDVLRLIDLIKDRVSHRMGVELETEIQIW